MTGLLWTTHAEELQEHGDIEEVENAVVVEIDHTGIIVALDLYSQNDRRAGRAGVGIGHNAGVHALELWGCDQAERG